MIPNLTFDTSCVVSLLGEDMTPEAEFNALVLIKQWQDEGKTKIYISEKSRTEASQDLERVKNSNTVDTKRKEKWEKTLDLLNHFEVTEGRWILGISRLGIDTVLGSDNDSILYEKINNLAIPDTKAEDRKLGDIFDTAILLEHAISNNQIFVTRDKILLKGNVQEVLLDELGITVCNPIEALLILKQDYGIS